MPKIALLGGSFNPPHVAHQMAALWALSCGGADQVWFMPCHRHPFGKALAPFDLRVEMCQAACGVFPPERARVTRIEAEDPRESRTLFTVRLLRERHPDLSFALLIGADILTEQESWYRFDEIQQLVEILVVGREGYPSPEGVPVLPPVSSSEIRRRLGAGQDVRALVPDDVLQHIHYHSLYRDPS